MNVVREFEDFLRIELKGDNVPGLLNDWDDCLLGMKNIPSPEVLETMFRKQLQRSHMFEKTMSFYLFGILNEGKEQSYEELRKLVDNCLEDRRMRSSRSEYEGGRKQLGAAGKQQNEGKVQGDCYNWLNKGDCSRGNDCGFTHDVNKKGKGKGQSPGRGRSPNRKGGGKDDGSEPPARGKSSGKGRKVVNPKIRGKSPSGKEDRPLCSFFGRGTCTKGQDCDYFHPKVCKFFKTEEGCTKGDACRDMHVKPKAAAAEQPQGKAKARPKGVRALLPRAGSSTTSRSAGSEASSPEAGRNPSPIGFGRSMDVAGWQTVGRRNTNKWMTAAYQGRCPEPHVDGAGGNPLLAENPFALFNDTDKIMDEIDENVGGEAGRNPKHDKQKSTYFPKSGVAGALMMAMTLSSTMQPAQSTMYGSIGSTCASVNKPKVHWPRWLIAKSVVQESGEKMSNEKIQKDRYRSGIPAIIEGNAEINRWDALRCIDNAYALYCEIVADKSGFDNKEIKLSDFYIEGKRLEDSLKPVCSAVTGQLHLQQRDYLVDSGSSFHVVGDDDLTTDEIKTVKLLKKPMILDTANGETRATHEMKAYVKDLGIFVRAIILAGSPPLLSLGLLVKEEGCNFTWDKNGPKVISANGKTLRCKIQHNVPHVTPAAKSAMKGTKVAESAEAVSSDKPEHHQHDLKAGSNPSPEIADGGKESSSSTEAVVASPPPAKISDDVTGGGTVAGRNPLLVKKKRKKTKKNKFGPVPTGAVHNVFTHFPKSKECEVCNSTKTMRAQCRKSDGEKRIDCPIVPRVFGDAITADHTILGDSTHDSDHSRNGDRVALIVQDRATHWIQGYPAPSKSAAETKMALERFMGPGKGPKYIFTDGSKEFEKARIELEWPGDASTPYRPETNGVAERPVCRVKEGTGAILVQSGWGEHWWDLAMQC